MRIAYLLGTYPSLSETFIAREIRALQPRGIDVRIFALHRPPAGKVHGAALGRTAPFTYGSLLAGALAGWQQWSRLPARPGALRDRLLAAGFAPHARAFGVEHIHAHFAFGPADVARVLADLLQVPFSVSVHARDIYTQSGAALTACLRDAAFVACCTRHGLEHVRSLCPTLPADQFCLARHGLFMPECTPPRGVSPSLLLAVGRLEPKKGFHCLIAACRILAARGLAVPCRIAGAGSLERDLARAIRDAGLSDTVRLIGAQTQAELADLYGLARVFVVPSMVAPDGDQDGLPNVLLEAMARQVPVIATRVGGIPEAVVDGDNGLLVDPDDPARLAEGIARLWGDEGLRQRLGARGRARIVEEFDINNTIGPLLERFAACAGRR